MTNCVPTYNELKDMMQSCTSILSASKKYNIPRKKLTKLLDEYGLKPTYFVNRDIKNELTKEKYKNMSAKEIALVLNIKVETVKYYKKDFTERIYDKSEIIEKIKKYNYDLENQGLVKQILFDDKNLYNSIIKHTEKHFLQSNKLTEKLYRIYHEYAEDHVPKCTYCVNSLKFYTFKLGYGNSNKICKNCLANHCGFGVSNVSQKLFDDIYNSMPIQKQKKIKYHNKTGEEIIKIENKDFVRLSQHVDFLNKNKYHIDFLMNNKIIEFDGKYWHKNEKCELAKDAFLQLKGYQILHISEHDYYKEPEKVLQKCINFLNQ